MTAGGRRDAELALAGLIERWCAPGGGVRVTDRTPRSSDPVLEGYAVVPRRDGAPGYLVPVGPGAPRPGAALAALRPGMNPRLATVAASVGLRVARRRVWVVADPGQPASRPETVSERAAGALGIDALYAVLAVRRPVPASKPTARLLDGDGVIRGYAKVGWSPATRALVDAESAALARRDGGDDLLVVPRLLAHEGLDDGRVLHVAAPLPEGLRPWSGEPSACLPVLATVAGPVRRHRLADSPWLAAVDRRLTDAEPVVSAEVRLLRTWRDALVSVAGEAELPHAAWHGDWVPWNLAQAADGRAVAWDWEYARDGVLLGFDAVHWHAQGQLARTGLVDAAARARAAAGAVHELGVPIGQVPLVVSSYLLELMTRAAWLAGEGNGWNPKIRTALGPVVRSECAALTELGAPSARR